MIKRKKGKIDGWKEEKYNEKWLKQRMKERTKG